MPPLAPWYHLGKILEIRLLSEFSVLFPPFPKDRIGKWDRIGRGEEVTLIWAELSPQSEDDCETSEVTRAREIWSILFDIARCTLLSCGQAAYETDWGHIRYVPLEAMWYSLVKWLVIGSADSSTASGPKGHGKLREWPQLWVLRILCTAVIPGRLLSALSWVSTTHEGMQDHVELFTKAVY